MKNREANDKKATEFMVINMMVNRQIGMKTILSYSGNQRATHEKGHEANGNIE